MPISSPQRAMEVFGSEFDAAWEFGALWISVWHPALSGRLARFMAGIGITRLYARQGRRLVRTARPSVRPRAEVDGGGTLDPALRDLPALPEPTPRILQGAVSRGSDMRRPCHLGEGRDPWFDTVLPLNTFSDHTSFTSVRLTVTWIPAFAGMTECARAACAHAAPHARDRFTRAA